MGPRYAMTSPPPKGEATVPLAVRRRLYARRRIPLFLPPLLFFFPASACFPGLSLLDFTPGSFYDFLAVSNLFFLNLRAPRQDNFMGFLRFSCTLELIFFIFASAPPGQLYVFSMIFLQSRIDFF